MLRKWPLTTLFIIATICVDVTVMLASGAGSVSAAESGLRFYVWNYAIPAQFSGLAVWAVFGRSHRLTKGAWVTLACGALFVLIWYTVEPLLLGETLAASLLQFFAVLIGVGVLRLCGIGKQLNTEPAETLRFSVMELLGWTIIVALWAFALRYVGTNFILDHYWWVWLITGTIAPLMVTPILFANLSLGSRPFALLAVYLFTLIAYALGRQLMEGPMPLWSLSMAMTQITYISAWWAVMRMDEAMQERNAVTEASREKLKVFEPDAR